MFRIFYAEKDATLYEAYPDYNTGLARIILTKDTNNSI